MTTLTGSGRVDRVMMRLDGWIRLVGKDRRQIDEECVHVLTAVVTCHRLQDAINHHTKS